MGSAHREGPFSDEGGEERGSGGAWDWSMAIVWERVRPIRYLGSDTLQT